MTSRERAPPEYRSEFARHELARKLKAVEAQLESGKVEIESLRVFAQMHRSTGCDWENRMLGIEGLNLKRVTVTMRCGVGGGEGVSDLVAVLTGGGGRTIIRSTS